MWVVDDAGHKLNASFAVERDGKLLALVLESEGGRTPAGHPPRNHEYRVALEVLLNRLKQRGAVLEDALVDSRVTRRLPEAERRLIGQRITLAGRSDIGALRRRLSTAQTSIGQAPTARRSGNGSKRIRLRLSVPSYGSKDATRLQNDLASPASPGGGEAGRERIDTVQVASRSTLDEQRVAVPVRSGAGYISDPIVRHAIEQHAVRSARALYGDYELEDVGTTESYDLRALKGDYEVHIEVKGSMNTTDDVELTTNEVQHARDHRTDLVVVDQIKLTQHSDGTMSTAGGHLRRWVNWQPADDDLKPTRYRYFLHAPTQDLAYHRQNWSAEAL